MPTFIDGIAASENLDSSGEIISIAGMDISSLDKTGNFNWEHKKDQPTQVVGKILYAKKIFKQEDCSDDRQKYYWNKCKVPYVYVMGELFDEYTDSSKHVAGLFKYDADKKGINEHNVLGFSIEGAKLDKKGMIITRSIARKCTITEAPCNKAAIAEQMPAKENKSDSLNEIFKSESPFKTEPYVEIELMKSEDVSESLKLLKNQSNPHEHAKTLGIAPMKKDMNLAPSSPAGLLQSEKKPAAAPSAPAAPKNPMAVPFRDPGHVMGRTSSGKDVLSHQRIHEYRGFSGKDHEDAAKMHYEHAQNAKDPKTGAHHLDRMKLHLQAAQTAARRAERFSTGLAAKKKKVLSKVQSQKPEQKVPEQNMEKALDAGSGMAAPSETVGGAALAQEDIDNAHSVAWHNLRDKKKKKNKWLARAEEEYQSWDKKEQFQEFLKARMPNLTKGEIDSIGRVLALKKSVEAEKALSKFSDIMMASEDKLPGGLADKKKPEDFDQEQLAEGVKVEMEHTDDEKLAREIAMDHLTEDKDYYKKLKTIEKSEKIDRAHPHVGKVISRGGEYFAKKPDGGMHHIPNKDHGKMLAGSHVKFGVNEHDDAVLHPRHIHELKQFSKK